MLRIMMMCFSAVLITLVVTQVLWPALLGRLLFPLFRSKIRKAESNLTERKTRKRVQEIEARALRLEHESQQHIHEALDEMIEGEENKQKGKVND